MIIFENQVIKERRLSKQYFGKIDDNKWIARSCNWSRGKKNYQQCTFSTFNVHPVMSIYHIKRSLFNNFALFALQ